MAGKQLTRQNATITTAAVEVKVLTISGKQVTLAVFRQLREEPLIAEDGTLNGEPWGVVNYHPDKCGSEVEHWHAVWQRGDELLRSHVRKVPIFDPDDVSRRIPKTFETPAVDRYVTAWVREWLADRMERHPLKAPRYSGDRVGDELVLRTKHDFAVTAYASVSAVDAIGKKFEVQQSSEWLETRRAELTKPPTPFSTQESRQAEVERALARFNEADAALAEAFATLDAEVNTWGSYPEIQAALSGAVQTEADRRQRHREACAAVAQLPQLFIAV